MTRSKRAAVAAIVLLAATAALLYLMGRPLICTCGSIDLWIGEPSSSRTSQMLSDWYSPSHIVHGFLFFAGLWLVARRWPLERRFLVALAIEAAWEIVENTPLIINRYREETAALGYTGDSVLNSMSDIAMMIAGFVLARRLPVWASVAIVLVMELVPLFVIRDNLTLNVWMLLAPNAAIKAWQSGGSASALVAHFMH
jgi:uncharacterized protein DUF2585